MDCACFPDYFESGAFLDRAFILAILPASLNLKKRSL